jgi:hypothetical protein
MEASLWNMPHRLCGFISVAAIMPQRSCSGKAHAFPRHRWFFRKAE